MDFYYVHVVRVYRKIGSTTLQYQQKAAYPGQKNNKLSTKQNILT